MIDLDAPPDSSSQTQPKNLATEISPALASPNADSKPPAPPQAQNSASLETSQPSKKGDLERNVSVVKQVRYDAAARFENTHQWILFCLNCTALGSVLFGLFQVFKINVLSQTSCGFLSLFYSILSMILALLLAGIDHKGMADQLKNSADQLVALQRDINSAKQDGSIAGKFGDLNRRYADVMISSKRNHPIEDYRRYRNREQFDKVKTLRLVIMKKTHELKVTTDNTRRVKLKTEISDIKSEIAHAKPTLSEQFLNVIQIHAFRATVFSVGCSPFLIIAFAGQPRLIVSALNMLPWR